MKKFKLNLKNLTTPLLALSLMAGYVGLFCGSVSATSVSSTFTPMPAGQNDLQTPGFGLGAQVTSSQASAPTWTTTAPQPGDPGDSTFVLGTNVFSAAYSYSPAGLCSSDTVDKLSIQLPNFSGISGGGEDVSYYNISIDGGSSLYTGNKDVSSLNFGGPFAIGGGVFAPSSYVLDTYTIAISPGLPVSSLGSIILYELRDMSDAYSDGATQVNLDTPTITVDYTEDPACVSSTPLATDPDISTTPSSTPVTINILGNDTGTGLSVSKVDNQTIASGDTITISNGSGTVKLNTDGTITFTPAAGFSGESMFSYSITDGASTVDTGVVRITVAAATTVTTTTNQTTSTTTQTNTLDKSSTLANTGGSTTVLISIAILSLSGAGLVRMKRARG